MNQAHAAAAVPQLETLPAGEPDATLTAPGAALQHWHDGAGQLVATGGRAGQAWWMHWPRLATYYFHAQGPVRAVPSAAGLDDAIADTFVRGVAPIVMIARGHEALHASAVSGPRGVVAFCAASGTGKSTIALAVAAHGLLHWADDTVVFHLTADGPVAVRMPCPVRVDDAARDAIGRRPPGRDTATTRPLARIYHLVRDGTIDAVRPAFAAVPARERFNGLLAHAHPFDLDGEPRRRRFLESLLALSARVEVFECRFAPSLEALPELARAIRGHVEEG